MSPAVSLAGISTYFPARYQTSQEIAAATGIPTDVIEQRFGLLGKHCAADAEHVSDMAVAAARPLLQRGEHHTDIGAVVYFGSAHKDYYLWSVAPKIQHALGLTRAFAVELMATSGCGPIALKVAKDMLAGEDSPGTVLLVGASCESRVINYRNPRSRFAFNFADGAAAALVRRGDGGHRLLGFAAITDGSFADDVCIAAGGTVHPVSAETLAAGMHTLDVRDRQGMKARLDPISLDRFVEVARLAVERSGCRVEDVDFLAPLHTKRSLHLELLRALGLREDQSYYLEAFGHMSAIDPFVCLVEGERAGRVKPGDLVVALSAGTGYTWTAVAIRW